MSSFVSREIGKRQAKLVNSARLNAEITKPCNIWDGTVALAPAEAKSHPQSVELRALQRRERAACRLGARHLRSV